MTAIYVVLLRQKQKGAWIEAKANKPANPEESGVPGGDEKVWLFAGPTMTPKENHAIKMAHYPTLISRLFVLVFYKGLLFNTKVLLCSVKNRKWTIEHDFKEHQIYEMVETSPFILMAKLDGEFIEFTIPNMNLENDSFLDPSDFHIKFNSVNKTIEEADWKGRDIKGDNDKIISLLVTALAFWAHPQTHIAAEKSAREISEKHVDALEPSGRFVVALHDGLLYGGKSPINGAHSLNIGGMGKSGIQSAMNTKLPHVFDPKKMQFRYYKFLMGSRMSLMKRMEEFNIDVNAEFLFNNMIVHSVDHHLLHGHLRNRTWSMDGGTSIKSYWRSKVFSTIWVRDLSTPMIEEKIGRLNAKKHPFYNALYNDLVPMDKELANCVIASTSF